MTCSRLDLIQQLSDLAHSKLPPELHGRLERGIALVLHEMIEPGAPGSYRVMNHNGSTFYTVNGTCSCADYPRAPDGWCKHRLGCAVYRKLQERLATEAQEARSATDATGGTSQEPSAAESIVEAHRGIPAEAIVLIQGKPFIKFAGLLKMAHAAGLVALEETWTYNDAELSLAHAVATFQDGRCFAGSGDATPRNVHRHVAPHFRRVSLTRAKSRALRDALNCDLVAVEELGDPD